MVRIPSTDDSDVKLNVARQLEPWSSDAVSVFTILNRCYVRTDDCVVGGHSCDPHVIWVDEHMKYRCDCVSDFRMEKVCGNIDDRGL